MKMEQANPNRNKADTQTALEGVVDAPPNSLTDSIQCDNCGAPLTQNMPMYHGPNGGNYCSIECVSQDLDVIKPDEGKAGDVNVPG